ncbi:MAG TPA: glutamyl-tRNA reductase, partial [Sphingobacteriaceae bacterium]|nr:glutamyl-tRNA reductase [Sphingobacteriaceae bacterium]
MKYLKVIAFTHKQIDLKELGEFVICNEMLDDRLRNLKEKFDIPEIFYLGTCNRVEFVFCASQSLNHEFVKDFIRTVNFCLPEGK